MLNVLVHRLFLMIAVDMVTYYAILVVPCKEIHRMTVLLQIFLDRTSLPFSPLGKNSHQIS